MRAPKEGSPQMPDTHIPAAPPISVREGAEIRYAETRADDVRMSLSTFPGHDNALLTIMCDGRAGAQMQVSISPECRAALIALLAQAGG